MWYLPEVSELYPQLFLKNIKLLLLTNTMHSHREIIGSINLKFGTDSPLTAGSFLFKLVPSLKSRQRSYEFSIAKDNCLHGRVLATCFHRAVNDWFLSYHWLEEILGKEKMHISLKLFLGFHENINFKIIKRLLIIRSQKLKYILNNWMLSSDLKQAYCELVYTELFLRLHFFLKNLNNIVFHYLVIRHIYLFLINYI